MKTQPLKGMRDLLPREQALRDYIQGQILDTYRAAGFQRISTPSWRIWKTWTNPMAATT